MGKIGSYEYPDKVSFKQALEIAEEALKNYGGTIPYKVVANKLGHIIKNGASIGGDVYRKFDDLCMYSLTIRDRGGLKATVLAEKAFNPIDTAKAAEGKAEAIRKIPIVAKAYAAWNGEIPVETAFPAEIGKIANISWIEAQKQAKSLRNLYNEVFSYLKSAPELPTVETTELGARRESEEMTETLPASPWVEGKAGDVLIRFPRSMKGVETAEKLLDLLKSEISEIKPTKQEKED